MRRFSFLLSLLSLTCGLNGFAQEKIFFDAKPNGSSYQTIWSMNTDGSGRIPLFNDSYHRCGCKVSANEPRIFYIKGKTSNEGFMGDSIWICKSNYDGSNEQAVWLFPDYQNYGLRSCFNFSSDEQKIVYATDNGVNRDGDVFELDLNTLVSTNLTNDVDFVEDDPVYKPNTDSIVYTKNGTGWYADPFPMYKMKNDGSGNALFIPMGNGHYHRPNFSTDGTIMVFCYVSCVGCNHEIYISNSNGSNPLLVVPSSGSNLQYPSFSPNNQNICYARNNNTQLVISDLSGAVISSIDTMGHGSFCNAVWVILNTVEINNPTEIKINIFPNPANDIIFISGITGGTLRLYDLSGRLLQEKDNKDNTFNVSGIAPGSYVLEVNTGNGVAREKVVID